MFDEDLEPTKKPKGPKVLDDMSVDELKDYVQDMKEEIKRVEAEIEGKNSHMNAAEGLFKS